MRIRLDIEYNGCNFCGWQRQNNVKTVQETVENAIAHVFNGKNVTLFVAGRTDTGVHAINQVAHFDICDDVWKYDTEKLTKAINFYLHDTGIIIINSKIVSDDFHARFSAKQRQYLYIIYNCDVDTVLLKNRVWFVHEKLDLSLMRDAADMFCGLHDFSAFRSAQCKSARTLRTIDSFTVEQNRNFIFLTIKSRSFLHNQVRIMVGTIKQIAARNMPKSQILKAFESHDRTLSGPTAPPYGLYFLKAVY